MNINHLRVLDLASTQSIIAPAKLLNVRNPPYHELYRHWKQSWGETGGSSKRPLKLTEPGY